MVKGLDVFIGHFELYPDHYILIGGAACDVQMEGLELEFRITKDLDIVLIVEALSNEFVQHFWKFIRDGAYEVSEVNAQKRFYRFLRPRNEGYPKMLELFARHPDALPPSEGLHITDIPVGEDMSSLSAILLDDDYYAFTLTNSEVRERLRVANNTALIGLKVKAFLNNLQRKAEGQPVQANDIIKHRNDVIRLATIIAGEVANAVTPKVRMDVIKFIDVLLNQQDNVKDVLKSSGLTVVTREEIVNQLRLVFGI